MGGSNTEAGMAKFLELKAAFEDVYEDTTKFFEKGNKAAAVRARKKLLRLREIAQEMRVLIQQTKSQLEQEQKTARTSGGGGGGALAENQASMAE